MTKTSNYTAQVFKHWMNLAFLAGVGFLGIIGGWELAVLGLLVEAGILWTVPDFPGVKRTLDNEARVKKLEAQRKYYLKMLWAMAPTGTNLFFTPIQVDWYKEASGYSCTSGGDFEKFKGLCKIINDLRGMENDQPGSVSADVIIRIEEMLNGYLSLLLVARTATENIQSINKDKLSREFDALRKATEDADPTDKAFRVVLAERLRSLKTKVDSLPRLERRKSLAMAQAENIVQSIEASAIQLRTQGAVELGAFTDTTLIVDMEAPVDELEIAAEVRGITSSSYELDVLDTTVWDDMAKKLGAPTKPPKTMKAPAKGESDDFMSRHTRPI